MGPVAAFLTGEPKPATGRPNFSGESTAASTDVKLELPVYGAAVGLRPGSVAVP